MIDANGRKVSAFTGKIQNLARVAELTDAVIDIAVSGAWRDYRFATGHEVWRAAEFDYFLIANGMRRDDVARVLAYNKRAKELAPLMDPDADKRKRRTLEKASAEWNRLNINLIERARDLGWIPDTRNEIARVDSPIGRRTWQKMPTAPRRGTKPVRRIWAVEWSDESVTAADAIVEKLLQDDVLARDVYKRLDAANSRRKYGDKRRSEAQNAPNVPGTTAI